jgi:hypothetical protein
MMQFYEIGLFSGIGYIGLIIFSIGAYFGGKILPLGLGIVPILFIGELIISIYYIKLSIKNKEIHFLCFSVIIFIMAFIAGINVDIYETKKAEENLINTGNIIEEYKIRNGLEYLTEDDINNINIPKEMEIELTGETYRLFFKNGIYYSKTKEVYFRPRP